MGMVVNNNIPALQAFNAVSATTNALQKSIAKLSTGLRINSAADDAAGLAISEKMRAQIRGLDQAVRNSQDGISMIQTAEGALNETHSILQRMRELSVQAANDTLTQQDRAYIQLEIDQLREEITRIGNTTQFNRKKLLDGSAAALWSSSDLNTRAIINGGLRQIDRFGQKSSVEGNFVIDINANPGRAQVQKTDIFTIKHSDVIMNVSYNHDFGINGVSVNNIPAGDYTITVGEARDVVITDPLRRAVVGIENWTADNGGVELTIVSANATTGIVTFNVALTGDLAAFGPVSPIEVSNTMSTNVFELGRDGDSNPLNLTIDLNGIDLTTLGANDTILLNVGSGTPAATNMSLTKVTLTGTDAADFETAGFKIAADDATSMELKGIDLEVIEGPTGTFFLSISGDFGAANDETFIIELTAGDKTFTAASGVTYTVSFGDVSGLADGDEATFDLERQAAVLNGTIAAGGGTALNTAFTTEGGASVTGTVDNNTAFNAANVKIVFGNAVTDAGTFNQAQLDAIRVSAEGVTINGQSMGTYLGTITSGLTEINTDGTLTVQFDDPNQTVMTFTFNFSTPASGNPAITAGANITFAGADLTPVGVAGAGIRMPTQPPETSGNVAHVGHFGVKGSGELVIMNAEGARSNASILLEVVTVNDVTGSVEFKATSNILNTNGSVETVVQNITLNANQRNWGELLGTQLDAKGQFVNGDLMLSLDGIIAGGTDSAAASTHFRVGDKMAFNVAATGPGLTFVNIEGTQTAGWPDGWTSEDNSVLFGGADNNLQFGLNANAVNGQNVHFRNFYINEDNGTVYTGNITLSLANTFSDDINKANPGDLLASFTAAYIGQTASGDVRLRDLDLMWNSEGRFLVTDPQRLTITQGDGSRTSITLYANDTLNDVTMKLNNAIAQQLGQQRHLNVDRTLRANNFATFVEERPGLPNSMRVGTDESVAGTIVIRSAIAGSNGTISFAGDEELLNALSLNTIQTAEENSFSVSVWDAHSGRSIASSVNITGNNLVGVIHENVDVVFDPMANIRVEWNEETRSFNLLKETGSFQTILHLVDNTTVFQIGANEGEDIGINIGDMRAEALGLNGVLVTDRASAARSITIIDNAIDRVSMQRARLGAYQNRLEHTINNLTVAGENLTAAESRIRDTDMAKEMMNFTRLSIMLQAGTSMLAQANMLPQNVLGLIR